MPEETQCDYYIDSIKAVFEQCAPANTIAAGVPLSAIVARDEIMERDHLAERSVEIGKKVTERYLAMKEKYACVGDVRGLDGMVGIEFVTSKATKEPATALTSAIRKQGSFIEKNAFEKAVRFPIQLFQTRFFFLFSFFIFYSSGSPSPLLIAAIAA